MFKNSEGELLHHSYIVKGDSNHIDSIKSTLGDDMSINTFTEDNLSVDTVRNIITQSDMVSRGGINVFLIYFNEATVSAQNSLLKALEEPKKNTIFILLTPNPSRLLDTIHSRCFNISNEESDLVNVDDFIALNMRDRLKYVEKMVKGHKDGKVSREDVVSFMSACMDKKKDNKGVFRRVFEIQKTMNLPSTSVKQSLESFAVCLD